MAGIPWEDWFYHLSAKRDEINSLHTQAVGLVNTTQSNILKLNSHLDDYKKLIAGNTLLLVVKSQVVMDDLKLSDYTTQVNALEPPPAGIIPLEFGEVISEAVGGGFVLRILWNSTKQVYRSFFKTAAKDGADATIESTSESLTEPLLESGMQEASITALRGAGTDIAETAIKTTVDVGEDVAESATKTILGDLTGASLAATGIGIFAAVGIDAVFGAINGAKERDELNKQINNLQTCVNKAQGFSDTVDAKTTAIKAKVAAEEQKFINLMNDLTKIKKATFPYNYAANWDNLAKFQTAQQHAMNEYKVFMELRNFYCRAKVRHPNGTKDSIIDAYLYSAPPSVTTAIANQYWDVLVKYSAVMKASKPCPPPPKSK
ncbi:MAG: hypothetical protein AAF614_04725 [Chloroflexota bacterium]